MEDEDRTVTQKELQAYSDYFELGWSAKLLVDYVENHREPEWPGGTVVKDATGHFFKKAIEYSGWWSFGSNVRVPFSFPVRPLTEV